MKNRRIGLSITVSLALLGLVACSSIKPAESLEDRNMAIASCGVMVRLLNGDIPIDASSYSEVTDTLTTFADKAPGEVKTTARFVLDDMNGKDFTEKESAKQIEKLKDYCMDYTVD